MTHTELVDSCLSSFNAGRFSEACRLFAERIAREDTCIGLSLSGALVPAGLGMSSLVPLIREGYIDWMTTTGANMYHDLHYTLGFEMFKGSPCADDEALRADGVVRIYDLYFEAEALFRTDDFVRSLFRRLHSQGALKGPISSADVHRHLGAELIAMNPASADYSVLAQACKSGVPIHAPSPGDSSIGMNLAALALEGIRIDLDPSKDVNETAGYVFAAKTAGRKTAVVLLGGGSPKNFMLQTEPHIQEVLGLSESGHDYFIQFTDARPDTGGLSGATPSEAVSWGKIDPSMLGNAVVCYGDCSVYLPMLALYVLEKAPPRKPARLWDQRLANLEKLAAEYSRNMGRKGASPGRHCRKKP